MTKQPPELEFSLLVLKEAVDKLVRPYRHVVTGVNDEGEPFERVLTLPPLLTQLHESIGSTINVTKRGASLSSTRSVIDASALMLEDSIRQDLKLLWKVSLGEASRSHVLRLAVVTWHRTFEAQARDQRFGLEYVWHVAKLVQTWMRQIELKFDPPVTLEVLRPCPACRETHVVDQFGDVARAILISWRQSFTNSTAVCRACSTSWVGESELRQLRWEIDQNDDTPAE